MFVVKRVLLRAMRVTMRAMRVMRARGASHASQGASHASHRFNVKKKLNKEYYYLTAANTVQITVQLFSDIVQFCLP